MTHTHGVEMTPDIDLDALTALEQGLPPAPWAVCCSQPAPGVRTEGGWEVAYTSYADSGPAVAAFIAAARNNWSALLSAFTATRAELEKVTAERNEADRLSEKLTLTIRAFPHADNAANIAHARAQRDAARAEADKLRAELRSSDSLIGCLYAAGVYKWEGHAAAVETYARFEAEAAAPQPDEPTRAERPLNARWERKPGNETVALHDCGGDPQCCGTPGDHDEAAGAGDGEQDTATTHACNCFMRGGKHSFKCNLARFGRPHYDVASVQGAADGEAQA